MVNIRHFKYLIRFITLEACKKKKNCASQSWVGEESLN